MNTTTTKRQWVIDFYAKYGDYTDFTRAHQLSDDQINKVYVILSTKGDAK